MVIARCEQSVLPIVLVSLSIGHKEVSMHLYGGEDDNGRPQPACDAGRNNAKYIRVLRDDAEMQNTSFCKSCYDVCTAADRLGKNRSGGILEKCLKCGEIYCRTRRPQHLIECISDDEKPDKPMPPDSRTP